MKDCSAPAIPRNANISNPSDTYNSGYKVTFKCNEGYNEEGIATQMCFQGKWTVLPFKCSGRVYTSLARVFPFTVKTNLAMFTLYQTSAPSREHGDFTDTP